MSPTLRQWYNPLMRVTACTAPPGGRQRGRKLLSSRGDELHTALPEPGKGSGASRSRRTGGDWAALEKGGGRGDGSDYLAEMGQAQDYNIDVDHGQNWTNIDYIFTGEKLGHKADIADGSLRNYEMRSLNNIVGDYYIAPRFLEEVALHIAKNILCDKGQIDARVPLILGIWGGKGQGKSFQVELAFKKLGVVPIIMSAGELEHEWAGTPGRLIRERYCKAADVLKNQGKLSCLLINDIDAGIGRFSDTQVTVNNQMVVGTLMNICDSPNMVSLGKDWKEDDFVNRVPIIVTGNDFSRVYAPLIRDGRMEKFYWSPSRTDLINILHAMYKDDGFQERDMEVLLDEFPNQPLDFYGSIRASAHDKHISDWLFMDVLKGKGADDWEEADLKELRRRLVFKQDLPKLEHIDITLDMLLEEGRRLTQEQDHVMQNRLSEEYLKNLSQEREVVKILEEERAKEAAKPTVIEPPPLPSQAYLEKLEAARESLKEAGFREEVQVEAEYVEETEASPWPQLPPQEAMALIQEEGYAYVDVRPAKDFERDSYKKALGLPFAKISGFGASAVTVELEDFVPEIRSRFPDLASKLILVGGDDGEFAADALSKLQAEGYQEVAEVLGGFAAWTKAYRPNGEARAAGGGWMSAEGREELFGTGG